MDTPQVLLDHHLKTLRLPTFLREYDKVAQQCAAEGVDFPRYLLRLSELELLDRDRRATERRIRQAKFEVVKSLDSFDFLAITFPVHLQDVNVMGEPIQQRSGQPFRSESLGPFVERQIAGHQRGTAFVAPAEDL